MPRGPTSMPAAGSGGGASGRATAFCLSEPGSNPGTDLAFLELLSIYSHWVSGYL